MAKPRPCVRSGCPGTHQQGRPALCDSCAKLARKNVGKRHATRDDLQAWVAETYGLKSDAELSEAQTDQRTPRETLESVKNDDGTVELIAMRDRPYTEDELLDLAQVDRRKWRARWLRVNAWGTVGAMRYQTRATLAPIAPLPVLDALEGFAADMRAHAVRVPAPRVRGKGEPVMLELAIMDHHFGLYCWSEEVGADYDLSIAERIWFDAVEDALALASQYRIEQWLFPVGNDFLHYSGFDAATERGTRQDTDTRFSKMLRTAYRAATVAIERMARVAPVHVVVMPGNHDRVPSIAMGHVIDAAFARTRAVTVDLSPMERKCHAYGCNLIGFAHGDRGKTSALAALMPTLWPREWAASTWREWHLGHLHKREAWTFRPVSTLDNGITTRILPSLCPPSAWAYSEGYIGTPRSAELHVWGREAGHLGYHTLGLRREEGAA